MPDKTMGELSVEVKAVKKDWVTDPNTGIVASVASRHVWGLENGQSVMRMSLVVQFDDEKVQIEEGDLVILQTPPKVV